MVTAKTNSNDRHILSTAQWITVSSLLLGGVLGLDMRLRYVVEAYSRNNMLDHNSIREEIRLLGTTIPPDWFREEVRDNTQTIKRFEADLSALRITMAELAVILKQCKELGYGKDVPR